MLCLQWTRWSFNLGEESADGGISDLVLKPGYLIAGEDTSFQKDLPTMLWQPREVSYRA
jgi:hypothetical protein